MEGWFLLLETKNVVRKVCHTRDQVRSDWFNAAQRLHKAHHRLPITGNFIHCNMNIIYKIHNKNINIFLNIFLY